MKSTVIQCVKCGCNFTLEKQRFTDKPKNICDDCLYDKAYYGEKITYANKMDTINKPKYQGRFLKGRQIIDDGLFWGIANPKDFPFFCGARTSIPKPKKNSPKLTIANTLIFKDGEIKLKYNEPIKYKIKK